MAVGRSSQEEGLVISGWWLVGKVVGRSSKEKKQPVRRTARLWLLWEVAFSARKVLTARKRKADAETDSRDGAGAAGD